jgi:hypothetical protein
MDRTVCHVSNVTAAIVPQRKQTICAILCKHSSFSYFILCFYASSQTIHSSEEKFQACGKSPASKEEGKSAA